VQEAIPADAAGDANIPAHIATEDRIPPVLEASSHAIAENFDPDVVEIVTSAIHIPAARSPASSAIGVAPSPSEEVGGGIPSSMAASVHSAVGGGAGTGNALESGGDVRRLSFISFADVVQAEHAEQQHGGNPSVSGEQAWSSILRSASPPLSSGQKSPAGSGVPGSPVGSVGAAGGEAAVVETMTRALKIAEESGGAEGPAERR
jgi:hypothetical protein